MKFLFDFFPLILFFTAFKVFDIYVATGVAIVASICQVGWLRWRRQPIETMHWITLGSIVILGGATIIVHDEVFIRWKPTVVYWLFSAILFGTQMFGRKTAIEHVMGKQLDLPSRIWRNMNLSFALFTLAMGFVNLYVAFFYGAELDPEVQREHWVNFKVFGTLIITFVFMFVIMLFVSKHLRLDDNRENG